ncbi:MAG: HlyD family secretion protein [Bacteroidetes bacterium]|nr:HlyD family secretion protein [Bacteroidota bacterium]
MSTQEPEELLDDEEIESVPLFKKKRVVIPLLIFVVAGAVVAYYWYIQYRNFVTTDDAFVDANRVSISSKILDRITELHADEGDTVHIGEILVRLDETDLRAQETQSRAALRLAEENIKLVTVNINRAQDDFARAETQFKAAVITREQYDHAKHALDAANAEMTIAQSKIAAARTQLGVVETQLKNTAIISPIEGIVAKRWLMNGDVAQPGQAIFTVYDQKNVWITANFEETKLHEILPGADVTISVDSYPGKTFYGKIFQVGTYTASEFSLIPPNNASGNFTKVTQRIPIKISIEYQSDAPPLFPGMSVEVSVKAKL